ncbi:hypothetical protein QT381_02750 [Galbitalea sp. SE-J8]|uniref:hypothetical protein n=1 Tax=Galbitalea sp. SE-J8 TaxID=3054952 RepID=UPI00259D0C42|nr:hypothetical protein [Galbitalea sp. SE-J8]MDM4761923.1 hypothetical protein [Galbitalea sp. SE-J8]
MSITHSRNSAQVALADTRGWNRPRYDGITGISHEQIARQKAVNDAQRARVAAGIRATGGDAASELLAALGLTEVA